MIPFENCLPYDKLMNDIYIPQCSFCGQENVLVPLRPSEFEDIRGGKKKLLIFPCCRSKVTVIDADADYLLTTQKLLRK